MWSLDWGSEDAWILLNAELEPGSGWSDLSVLVPIAALGYDQKKYVYFVTESGNEYPHNGGFEEWALQDVDRGCLEVTKVVDWQGVDPDPEQTFYVDVIYPDGVITITLEFDYTGGTQTVEGLMPGVYTVVEQDPGAAWLVSGSTYPVEVTTDSACAEVTVTNTYNFGCLSVEKVVDWNGVPEDTAKMFYVDVLDADDMLVGTLEFGSDGGTECLGDLVPGDYTLVEQDPGDEWSISGDDGAAVTVVAGDECPECTATAIITNTHLLGCLSVEKVVDWNGVPEDTAKMFYVDVLDADDMLVGTLEFGSDGGTECLGDLVPGDYTLVEQDPGDEWSISGDDGAAVTVVAGDECPECTATAIITNTYVNEWCGYTIGFWKNNIDKYLDEKAKGRQVPDEFFEEVDPEVICGDVDPSLTCDEWEEVYELIANYDPTSAQEKAIAQMLAMRLSGEYNEEGFSYSIDYTRYMWYDEVEMEWVYEDCYYVLEWASEEIGANPMDVGDLWELVQALYDDDDESFNQAQELADCINNYKWGCVD